jgi:hypothetical protein
MSRKALAMGAAATARTVKGRRGLQIWTRIFHSQPHTATTSRTQPRFAKI